jgi:solute:Na+ symporter, SSS family
VGLDHARHGGGLHPGLGLNWTNWVAGVVSVYATLFGVGRLIFGDLVQAGVFLGVAAVSFAWIARNLQQEGPQRVPDRVGS